MSNLTDLFAHPSNLAAASIFNGLPSPPRSTSPTTLTAIPIIGNSFQSSNQGFSQHPPHTFLNLPPSQHPQNLQIIPIFIPTTNTGNDDSASSEISVNRVSQALIDKWNSEYGNTDYKKKARILIKKMRQLGGLEPSTRTTDIPEARMGLLILSGLADQTCKMGALCSLLEILKNDSLEKSNCNRLVELAVKLLNLMEREVLEQTNLEAQIKLSEVYSILTETLHHHCGKGHINAITEELKLSLSRAPAALKKLNRLENIKIKFNTHCALESVCRLKDDKQELFKIVEGLYNVIVGAASLYLQDAQTGFPRLEEAFKGINPQLPNAWYNSVLILKSLARNVHANPEELTPLLMLIDKKFKKLNWKFTYAAIEILAEIASNGQNPAVRLRALTRLMKFADCEGLKTYTSFKPLTHLELPQKINPNIRIKEACMDSLIKLAKTTHDPEIAQVTTAFLSLEEDDGLLHIEEDDLLYFEPAADLS